MDSFIDNPDITDQLPTEVGDYWFYGYRYGKKWDEDKRLILCEVVEIANNDTLVIGNGQTLWPNEIEEALFIPATLPELPKETT